MMRSIILFFVFVGFASAEVTTTPINASRFSSDLLISATPPQIGALFGNCDKLCQILGANSAKCNMKLGKTGSYSPTELFGDKGTLHVLYANPNHEMRFAFEPDNANYICEYRITIMPSRGASRLSYELRFMQLNTIPAGQLQKCSNVISVGTAKIKQWTVGH